MPESSYQLPPDGSGKLISTWQDPVTLKHSEYVRLASHRGGELYRAASELIVLTATASLRIWGIFNPTGSGKTLYVRRVNVYLNASAVGTVVAVPLRRTSDATTTGTVITPVRPDNGAINSVAAVRALPTAGTPAGGNFAVTTTPSTAGSIVDTSLYSSDSLMSRDIIIPAGTGLVWLVSGTPDADLRAGVECLWEEAA